MGIETEPKHKSISVEKMGEVVNSLDEASKLTLRERIAFILKDSKCREAYQAITRTLINAGITATDLIPGAGEAVEGLILGLKVTPKIKEILLKYVKDPKNSAKHLDLTPDISISQQFMITSATAPVEFLSGGTIPSYLINTLWQLRADIKNGRFEGARDAIRVLMTGERTKLTPEVRARLDAAAKEFRI